MSRFISTISSAVLGLLSGIVIFGGFFCLVYIVFDLTEKFNGNYANGGVIGTPQNLIYAAFVAGTIAGATLGFFTGLMTGIFKASGLFQTILISLSVTEFFIVTLVIAYEYSSYRLPGDFFDTMLSIVVSIVLCSAILLIPSLLIGTAVAKLRRLTVMNVRPHHFSCIVC